MFKELDSSLEVRDVEIHSRYLHSIPDKCRWERYKLANPAPAAMG